MRPELCPVQAWKLNRTSCLKRALSEWDNCEGCLKVNKLRKSKIGINSFSRPHNIPYFNNFQSPSRHVTRPPWWQLSRLCTGASEHHFGVLCRCMPTVQPHQAPDNSGRRIHVIKQGNRGQAQRGKTDRCPWYLGVGVDSISSDSHVSSGTIESLTSPDMCFTHPCLASLCHLTWQERRDGEKESRRWTEGHCHGRGVLVSVSQKEFMSTRYTSLQRGWERTEMFKNDQLFIFKCIRF